MLGEASTTEIARNKDAQGYVENRKAALEGGTVAGRARRDLEEKSGKRVVSRENFKALTEAAVRRQVKVKAGWTGSGRIAARHGTAASTAAIRPASAEDQHERHFFLAQTVTVRPEPVEGRGAPGSENQ